MTSSDSARRERSDAALAKKTGGDSGDSDEILAGVGAVFESLGRAVLCLDHDFLVVHASGGLPGLLGGLQPADVVGLSAARILGDALFGEGGHLRLALEAGERREGWGATVQQPDGTRRLVSVTGAPMLQGADGCDPRVAYILALRSAGEWSEGEAEQTTLFSGMIGRSRAMHDIFRLIGNLQHSEATILITGESGTGKELVAHAIHEHSPRAAGPFVAVNSGAIPSELLESELFGHVKGAFTGAIRDRMGRFELASPGTLFLDEIGDLPLPLQVKILRVLQERTFERVGESRSRRTEARIIAATNADLEEAVSMGSFREDLYYRLRVVPIRVSPLRQRREDVDPLARYLLERVGRRHGRALQLAPDAIRALMAYAWPGNVRELENALEYAVAVCRGQTIHPADLPEEIGGRAIQPAEEGPMSAAVVPEPADASPGQLQPSDSLLAEPPGDDAAALRAALEAHRWNRSATAEALGISRTTLWRRMRELGLLPDRS